MSCKTRRQCFEGHFYEFDDWSPIFAKCVVWCPIIAIFSTATRHFAKISRRSRKPLNPFPPIRSGTVAHMRMTTT